MACDVSPVAMFFYHTGDHDDNELCTVPACFHHPPHHHKMKSFHRHHHHFHPHNHHDDNELCAVPACYGLWSVRKEALETR